MSQIFRRSPATGAAAPASLSMLIRRPVVSNVPLTLAKPTGVPAAIADHGADAEIGIIGFSEDYLARHCHEPLLYSSLVWFDVEPERASSMCAGASRLSFEKTRPLRWSA